MHTCVYAWRDGMGEGRARLALVRVLQLMLSSTFAPHNPHLAMALKPPLPSHSLHLALSDELPGSAQAASAGERLEERRAPRRQRLGISPGSSLTDTETDEASYTSRLRHGLVNTRCYASQR